MKWSAEAPVSKHNEFKNFRAIVLAESPQAAELRRKLERLTMSPRDQFQPKGGTNGPTPRELAEAIAKAEPVEEEAHLFVRDGASVRYNRSDRHWHVFGRKGLNGSDRDYKVKQMFFKNEEHLQSVLETNGFRESHGVVIDPKRYR